MRNGNDYVVGGAVALSVGAAMLGASIVGMILSKKVPPSFSVGVTNSGLYAAGRF
jgi:hypothetical protein